MSSNVNQLDDQRPHFTIQGRKAVYVIPVLVFQRIATDKIPLSQLEEFDDIMPTIVKEWLEKCHDIKCS